MWCEEERTALTAKRGTQVSKLRKASCVATESNVYRNCIYLNHAHWEENGEENKKAKDTPMGTRFREPRCSTRTHTHARTHAVVVHPCVDTYGQVKQMLLPFQIAVELQVVGELSFIFTLCLELLPSSQASLVSCNRPCIPPQHGVRGRNVTFFQVVWVHCCYLVSSRPQCRSEKQILRSIVSAFCFVLKVGDECKPKPQRHGTAVARARTLNTSRQTRHKRRTMHTHAVQLNTRNTLFILSQNN